MYIRLLVPFALHVFVLTHVSNGGYLYNIPANSSETLYLVGYSSELNNSNINCVKSEYRDPRSSNVRRILSMTVYNTTTGQSDLTAFVTFIDIPESPIISSINITEHTDDMGISGSCSCSIYEYVFRTRSVPLADRQVGESYRRIDKLQSNLLQ
ncbi:uncharacterized protein LOC142591084 isoform X7 [Dermacentor variabilis]|uniref:uncharacterized protein LOC142591084 isoform X7 n=1 Tax=Dermacentor variabilis TaxID=34621 RepID=UPI003F5C926D